MRHHGVTVLLLLAVSVAILLFAGTGLVVWLVLPWMHARQDAEMRAIQVRVAAEQAAANALAEAPRPEVDEKKAYILLIDNSASMAATDVEPTRLHMARRAALQFIDAAPDRLGMVIAFNSGTELLQQLTPDRTKLRAAVEAIRQTHRTTRIDDALSLADAVARAQPIDVHLFSDGRFPDRTEGVSEDLDLHYHRIGAEATDGPHNLAMAELSVRPVSGTRLQVNGRILNFGNHSEKATVQIAMQKDGQTVRERMQEVPVPASRVREGETKRSPGEGTFTFELRVDDKAIIILHAELQDEDLLELDNETWLVVDLPTLAAGKTTAGELPGLPGQAKAIRLDGEFDRVDVVAPDGGKRTLARGQQGEFLYTATEQVGLYQVLVQDRVVRRFAVGLLDRDESDLGPRPEFRIGEKVVRLQAQR